MHRAAVSVAASFAPGMLQATTGAGAAVYYPPALTGLRGSHAGSLDVAHALRDGKRLPRDIGYGHTRQRVANAPFIESCQSRSIC
jgi:hypothetical protein